MSDVIPATAPPISIPLEGATNVRDLGGYVGADARKVRRGQVFRSASLAGMTPDDLRRLDALGLRTVCDLRGVAERARRPAPLGAIPHVAVHSLPIEPKVGASLRDLVETRETTGEDVMTVMRRAYVAYARECHPQYRAMFDRVRDPNSHAVLFHCSAGKDRTGFGAALLLTALGVGWDDVMADYMATNRLWVPDEDVAERLPEPIAGVLLRVHPPLLIAAFDAIREDYGSVDAYLDARLGLSATGLLALRDLMLEG